MDEFSVVNDSDVEIIETNLLMAVPAADVAALVLCCLLVLRWTM